MKKILLLTGAFILTALSANAFDYLGPTNEGNRNFATIKQHQFEKQETLDFVNNSEEYKAKREKKDAILDYQQGKTNELPANLKPQINVTKPANTGMEFTKGEDGQIKIQEIR